MNSHNQRLSTGPAGSLNWPSYNLGDFLFALDLTTEQRSRLQQHNHHNRYLHNYGVICGLWVVPANETGRPWAIQVCPGYAIGCCGEEIEVSKPVVVDVREYLWKRSHDSSGSAYIAIRYIEQFLSPKPTPSKSCTCEVTVYEDSRIQDGFQLDILWSLPETVDTENFDLCAQQLLPCPQCLETSYIFLASINLPVGEAELITHDHISNGVSTR